MNELRQVPDTREEKNRKGLEKNEKKGYVP